MCAEETVISPTDLVHEPQPDGNGHFQEAKFIYITSAENEGEGESTTRLEVFG